MIKRLFDFLSVEFETDDYLIVRKIVLLNAFLLLGVGLFSLFTVINLFIVPNFPVAFLDALAGSLLFFALIDLHYRKKIRRAAFIGSATMTVFMIVFVVVNQNESFGLIWSFFIPIFVISIYGYRIGLWVSLLYYVLLFGVAFWGVGEWHSSDWDMVAFLRLVFASALLVFVIYMTEFSLSRMQDSLNALSETDHLTSLYNRRKIDELIAREVAFSKRYKTPLSVIVFDIDDFKQVNDLFGHLAGDDILVEMSRLLQEVIRETDSLGRWGGEEFILIMPNTIEEDAVQYAKRLLQEINTFHFTHATHLTCSFGVCSFHDDVDSAEKLIGCADHALYAAKHSGKNCVEVSTE